MTQNAFFENGIIKDIGAHVVKASSGNAPSGSVAYPDVMVVTVSDTAQIGWTWDGTTAAPPVPAAIDLRAYAASVRYAKEIGGITVAGMEIATDRASQAMINGAWASTQINANFSTQWKSANGTWSLLNAAEILAIATAVTAHVASCFAAEQLVDGEIASGAIKSTADVDAAFAAVT